MTSSTEWIKISPGKYWTEPKPSEPVALHVYVSPYDVPEAVRSCYDAVDHLFTIQFKYVGGEEAKRQALGDREVALLGRNSNRLQEVVFHVTDADSSRMRESIERFVEYARAFLPGSQTPQANLDIAMGAIVENESKLLDALTEA